MQDITLDQYQSMAPTLTEAEHRTLAGRLGQVCGKANIADDTAGHILAIVQQITDAADAYVRAAFAAAAAENADLPRSVALQIAQDEDAVAVPFLAVSEVLTDADLLQLVDLATTNEKRLAISRRQQISEDLSARLAETGDWTVRKTLLQNPGAKIGAPTYDLIIVRDRQQPDLQDVIIQGRQLPAEIVAKFIRIIESAYIEQLIARHALTPAQAYTLATDVNCDSLIGLASDLSMDRLSALVRYLSDRGEVTPYLIFKAICRGNMQFLVAFLAQCSELSPAEVSDRLRADHLMHLKILWRTTGFPEEFVPLIGEALAILKESVQDCRKRDIPVQQALIFQRLISGLETVEARLSQEELRDLWVSYA